MAKAYVFDCNGTLTDKRVKLNKGVVEFFYKILQNDKDARFMICSGNSLKALKETTNY